MIIQIIVEKILQATGNMLIPMLAQIIGSVINIALDPILIFGYFGFPELGIAGAAIATVFSQFLGMCIVLVGLKLQKSELHITFKNFKINFSIILEIYKVGLPAIIMQTVNSLLTIALNGILSGFSDAAVSVLGIYFRVQSFILMPVFGLTHGLMPIMGYNYGAKNKKRLMHTLKVGITIAVVVMATGTLIFMIFPTQLLSIFNPTDEVMLIGTYAFRAISSCFVFAAFSIIVSTWFQSIGNGKYSMYISLMRQLIFLLPSAYIFSFFGVQYVWFAYPLAEIFAIFASIFLLKAVYKKQIAPMPD